LSNKKDIKIKAFSVLLYHLALSYRACSKIIGELESVSYESIRNWYTSSKNLFNVEKKERRAIAVDETMIKLENEQIFLWIAIDVDNKEILSVYLSKSRSGLDTILFLKRALKHCTNKPRIIADKGP
jgi:putative transposase